MKEINFISSENVVNIASLKRIGMHDELTKYNNAFILATSIGKKNDFNSKTNDSVHLSTVFFKNSEMFMIQSSLNKFIKKSAMPKEITIRINN